MFRRRSRYTPSPLAEARLDFQRRNAAHAQRYRTHRRRTAVKRFVASLFRKLRLFD
jgi:hypothetical protein